MDASISYKRILRWQNCSSSSTTTIARMLYVIANRCKDLIEKFANSNLNVTHSSTMATGIFSWNMVRNLIRIVEHTVGMRKSSIKFIAIKVNFAIFFSYLPHVLTHSRSQKDILHALPWHSNTFCDTFLLLIWHEGKQIYACKCYSILQIFYSQSSYCCHCYFPLRRSMGKLKWVWAKYEILWKILSTRTHTHPTLYIWIYCEHKKGFFKQKFVRIDVYKCRILLKFYGESEMNGIQHIRAYTHTKKGSNCNMEFYCL